jgi:hypothetical protein
MLDGKTVMAILKMVNAQRMRVIADHFSALAAWAVKGPPGIRTARKHQRSDQSYGTKQPFSCI